MTKFTKILIASSLLLSISLPVLAVETVDTNQYPNTTATTTTDVLPSNQTLTPKQKMMGLRKQQQEEKKKLLEKQKQEREAKKQELAAKKTADLAVGLACMQTAVEKRENAIIAAFDAFSTASKTALTARRDALKAAWGITDRKERVKAINKAWADFRKAKKDAAAAFNTARKAAWTQFNQDTKTCKTAGAPITDDANGSKADMNMSVGL